MTTEFVSVSEDTPVDEALAAVRRIARIGAPRGDEHDLHDGSRGTRKGVMSLRELLAAPEGGKVSDIAWEEVQTVPVTADREEVARLIREYDLVAVPVVDENGVISGRRHGRRRHRRTRRGAHRRRPALRWNGSARRAVHADRFLLDDQEARALARRAFSERDADDDGDGALSGRAREGGRARAVHSADHQLRRKLRLAGDVADHPRAGTQEMQASRLVEVMLRELPSGLMLGAILGLMGIGRILLWQNLASRVIRTRICSR